MHKIIAYKIPLVQDDIDWLKDKAIHYLKMMRDSIDHEEKIMYWLMFQCYNDLYMQNKGGISNDNT